MNFRLLIVSLIPAHVQAGDVTPEQARDDLRAIVESDVFWRVLGSNVLSEMAAVGEDMAARSLAPPDLRLLKWDGGRATRKGHESE
jgi:hypothetical protein